MANGMSSDSPKTVAGLKRTVPRPRLDPLGLLVAASSTMAG